MNNLNSKVSTIQESQKEFEEMCRLAGQLLDRLEDQMNKYEHVCQVIQSYEESLAGVTEVYQKQQKKLTEARNAAAQISKGR